jgi:salicylate hydroxylase
MPSVAQGAAQAVEDAGVLTKVFTKTSDVDLALAVYELVRKDRAEKIQTSAVDTRNTLHLPDGKAQRKRDENIRAVNQGGPNPDKWADPSWQEDMYGVDVMRETREKWEELLEKVEGHLVDLVSRMSSHDI